MLPAMANSVSLQTLRELCTAANEAVAAIEAAPRPVPSHMADDYWRARSILCDLEDAVRNAELGLPVLLAIPAVAGLLYAGYRVVDTLDEVVKTVGAGSRQVVQHASNALSLATYAVVGLFVYNMARKRMA